MAGGEVVDALVIGSGVSGSSLAYELHKKNIDCIVTEARDVVGGNVITKTNEEGFLWEEGPNTFQPTRQIMRLATDLGLKDEVVFADHRLPRYVFWEENLYALPSKPEDAPFFALLNPFEKIRAGIGALGFHAPKPDYEESVKDFIYRHLGEAVYKKIIDPFVSGVYAGDPSKLSMAAAFKKIYSLEDLGSTPSILEGGLLRQAERAREARENYDPEIPTYTPGALGSFKKGLQSLPLAVQQKMGEERVRTSWKVESISKNADGTYTAKYSTPQGPKTITARTIAVTSPAHATRTILEGMIPEAKRLDDIYYPCVTSVTLAYPKEAFKDSVRREREGLGQRLFGFGNLIPRSMNIRTLGTIWCSSLFPYRAPEGYEMLLSYIGGAQDPYKYDPPIADMKDEDVVDAVHNDVSKILLKDGAPRPKVLGVRKWPKAIPQYNKGHLAIRAEVDKGLARCPGVYLGGNYVSGVAFGDCVQWGVDTAPNVIEYLKSAPQAGVGADEGAALAV